MSDQPPTPTPLPPSVRGSNKPDKKAVAGAAVGVGVFVLAQFGVVEAIPTGVESSLVLLTFYFWPNR